MKKTAWLFAALSICACSFTACGGDDDKDETPATTTAQEGQACSNDIKCADGLTCNASTNKCEKTSGTPAADDSCKGKQANDVCGVNKVCDANLKCVDKAADGGDKAQKGEDCSSKACAEGLICGDDKKCAEKPADGGDKAQKGEDCSSKACDAGLKCDDTSKKCVEDKGGEGGDKAQKGEDCSSKACDAGLKCDDASKKCVEDKGGEGDKKAGKGEACSAEILCDAGLKCDDASKKCVEDKGDEGDVKCDEANPCANKSSICNLDEKKCVKLEACDPTKFAEFCTHGGIATCEDKQMKVYECANQGEGLVCHKLGDKDVQCVEFCKDGDKPKNVCIANQYDESKPSTFVSVQTCQKNEADGKYIYFQTSSKTCDQGKVCVKGECVSEGAEVDCSTAIIKEDYTRKCDKNMLILTYTSSKYKSCNDAKDAKVDCTDHGGCVAKGDDDANCKDWQ